MKDIKDYLPYYFGQKFIYKSHVYSICRIDDFVRGTRISEAGFEKWNECKPEECKLLLRRLSDITEDEIKELIGWEKMNAMYTDLRYKLHPGICINIEYSIDAGDEGVYPQFHTVSFQTPTIPHFHWLLKKGFDLFGLIDAGIAIDAKTATP